MSRHKHTTFTIFLSRLFQANLAYGGSVYNITDLGTIQDRCCGLSSYGLAVNDSGQVTGLATTNDSVGPFGFVDSQPVAFIACSEESMYWLGIATVCNGQQKPDTCSVHWFDLDSSLYKRTNSSAMWRISLN
ncbi:MULTISPECIES: hypothetical protein [Methylomonas]|uniref:hypothetical protein n=1 Tax=Methylomonas TaxID=416 RepID=UPI00104E20E1|nr:MULTISPECIES: hypothetical protein [Methylomonas]